MKKYIDNKLYNTETAQEIGEWDNGGFGTFNYVSETLYLKRSGEYFLYGEGGANSRYSRLCGANSWCGDEQIIPMTLEEADYWAREHLSGDEYEAAFGAIPEDDSVVLVGYKLKRHTAERIKQLSREQGKAISEVAQELLDNALSV